MYKESQAVLIQSNDRKFFYALEECMKYGKPFIIENAKEAIDPLL